jgi:putative PEP-CTERM system TPR-repeat lipoprotein
MKINCRTFVLPLLLLSAGYLTPVASASSRDSVKYLLEGRAALKKGNFDKAFSSFGEAIKEDPSNDDARVELGTLLLRAGQYADAEQQFARALKGQIPAAKVAPMLAGTLLAEGKFNETLDVVPCPDDADCKGEVLASHARARLALKDIEGAEADALAAQQAAPKNIASRLARALVLNAQKDPAGAEKLVDSVLESKAGLPEALTLKGELRGLAGDLDGAIKSFRASLASNPNDLRTHVELVMALFSGDHDADAAVEIDQMLSQEIAATDAIAGAKVSKPPSPSEDTDAIVQKEGERLGGVTPTMIMASYLKAMLLVRANKMTEAMDTVRPVEVLISNRIPRSAFLLAEIHAANNHLEQALQYAGDFVTAFPDNLAGIRLLADINFRIGAFQRVIDILEPRVERFADDGGALNLLGSSYLAEGRLDLANRYLSEALKKRPDDTLTKANLALTLTRGKATREEGIRQLEGLVKANPNDSQIDLSLITTHFASGDYARAIDAATDMGKRQPNSPLPLTLRGLAETESGDDATAQSDFENALAKDPNFVPATLSLAELDMRSGNSSAAQNHLDVALKSKPANLPILLARANIEIRIGHPAAAIPFLKTAIAAHPDDAEAPAQLLHIQLATGDTVQALATAQEMAHNHPANFQIVDDAATTCIRLGKGDVGLQMFRDLETRYPNSAIVSHRFGRLLASMGNFAEARAKYSRAVDENPDFLPAWIDFALIERHVGGFDAAMDVVRKAQAHNPKSDLAAVMGGDLLRANGRLAEAEQTYRKIQTKKPSSEAVSRLFQVQIQQGERGPALDTAREWLKTTPGDNRIRMELAQEEMAEGNVPAAIEQYEFVAGKVSRDATVLNNLAWAYDRANDPRAIDTAKRAFRIAPDDAAVMDTYAYLLYRKGDRKQGADLLRQAYGAAPRSASIAFHMALVLADTNDAEQARRILKPLIDNKTAFDEAENARQLYKKLGGV